MRALKKLRAPRTQSIDFIKAYPEFEPIIQLYHFSAVFLTLHDWQSYNEKWHGFRELKIPAISFRGTFSIRLRLKSASLPLG